MTSENGNNAVELATELTIAWLGNFNNRINADDVPGFLQRMHETVQSLSGAPEAGKASGEAAKEYTPAVSVRKSLASPDYILSMIDGKPYKALRRHLSTNGLTADEYRQRYGLKDNYPMVAPTYSDARRAMAHKSGLGRKAGETNAGTAGAKSARGRRGGTSAKAPADQPAQ